ncbi:MAG: hypothetical protein CMG00_03335 [Candidatus Marinimicrobia bacterium]|nr:hypothetical protein [Candidatus Neomarinimicrobiota bacterium]|tara:strand:+ start:3188 stop:4729 length:1542 start_codon:yes stop_codon:yes gene_type:complete
MMSDYVKILWADDEINLLKSHVIFLEDKGFNVETVSSGEEAFSLCKKNRYDVVLLDEMMAGMDGIETLQKIKKINPAIPVIMITKNEEEWLMDEAIASQISDYLIKPVSPVQIFLSCKKNVDSDKIRTNKMIKQFLDEYNSIQESIKSISNIDEWLDMIDKIIDWELEIDSINDEAIKPFLKDLKNSTDKNFVNYFEKNYTDLLNSDFFPNKFIKKYLEPSFRSNQKTALIVLDCLRYDQAKFLLQKLCSDFEVKISSALSFLPTSTQYSRNSIFSGLFPDELKDKFPFEWKQMMENESKLNHFENIFFKEYLKSNSFDHISNHYEKIVELNQGNKLYNKIKEYRSIDCISIVVNFIDILGHSFSKSKIIKEIIPNDHSYRKEVLNWFEDSWLYKTLIEFKKNNRKIIITSDHGTTIVNRPTIIKADKNTSSGLRYKKGINLNVSNKEGILIKNPSDYHLPIASLNENYIIAKPGYYFVYPNDYNKYKNLYINSYQHGGVSIDELLLPVLELK